MLGAIGAGKSHVARLAASLADGAVVDADVLAGRALEAAAADGRLEETLGAWAVAADGTPARKAIAERVFADREALDRLEQLVHPEVLTRLRTHLEAHGRGEGPALLVLDVPLLLEAGLLDACDALWYVEVDDRMRLARAARRGLDAAEVRRRERRQRPREEKRAHADLVILNDDDPTAQVVLGLQSLGLLPSTSLPSSPDGR